MHRSLRTWTRLANLPDGDGSSARRPPDGDGASARRWGVRGDSSTRGGDWGGTTRTGASSSLSSSSTTAFSTPTAGPSSSDSSSSTGAASRAAMRAFVSCSDLRSSSQRCDVNSSSARNSSSRFWMSCSASSMCSGAATAKPMAASSSSDSESSTRSASSSRVGGPSRVGGHWGGVSGVSRRGSGVSGVIGGRRGEGEAAGRRGEGEAQRVGDATLASGDRGGVAGGRRGSFESMDDRYWASPQALACCACSADSWRASASAWFSSRSLASWAARFRIKTRSRALRPSFRGEKACFAASEGSCRFLASATRGEAGGTFFAASSRAANRRSCSLRSSASTRRRSAASSCSRRRSASARRRSAAAAWRTRAWRRASASSSSSLSALSFSTISRWRARSASRARSPRGVVARGLPVPRAAVGLARAFCLPGLPRAVRLARAFRPPAARHRCSGAAPPRRAACAPPPRPSVYSPSARAREPVELRRRAAGRAAAGRPTPVAARRCGRAARPAPTRARGSLPLSGHGPLPLALAAARAACAAAPPRRRRRSASSRSRSRSRRRASRSFLNLNSACSTAPLRSSSLLNCSLRSRARRCALRGSSSLFSSGFKACWMTSPMRNSSSCALNASTSGDDADRSSATQTAAARTARVPAPIDCDGRRTKSGEEAPDVLAHEGSPQNRFQCRTLRRLCREHRPHQIGEML